MRGRAARWQRRRVSAVRTRPVSGSRCVRRRRGVRRVPGLRPGTQSARGIVDTSAAGCRALDGAVAAWSALRSRSCCRRSCSAGFTRAAIYGAAMIGARSRSSWAVLMAAPVRHQFWKAALRANPLQATELRKRQQGSAGVRAARAQGVVSRRGHIAASGLPSTPRTSTRSRRFVRFHALGRGGGSRSCARAGRAGCGFRAQWRVGFDVRGARRPVVRFSPGRSRLLLGVRRAGPARVVGGRRRLVRAYALPHAGICHAGVAIGYERVCRCARRAPAGRPRTRVTCWRTPAASRRRGDGRRPGLENRARRGTVRPAGGPGSACLQACMSFTDSMGARHGRSRIVAVPWQRLADPHRRGDLAEIQL